MYSMWKIMFFFFNFKPHKHIALHQIHKIMFFLATSYDPFNVDWTEDTKAMEVINNILPLSSGSILPKVKPFSKHCNQMRF